MELLIGNEDLSGRLISYGVEYNRRYSIMSRILCNDTDDSRAVPESYGEEGETVQLHVPQHNAVIEDVVPSMVNPAAVETKLDFVNLRLEYIKRSQFAKTAIEKTTVEQFAELTDKSLNACLDALVTYTNNVVFNEIYKKTYFYEGSVSTSPFGSNLKIASRAAARLSAQSVRFMDRYMVLDTFNYSDATVLAPFIDASQSNDPMVVESGLIQKPKLGFSWYQLPKTTVHIAGVPGGTITVDDATLAGVDSIAIDNTGAGTLNEGDIIEVAGYKHGLVVTEDVEWTAPGVELVKISPKLETDLVGGESITVLGDHTVGLAFHRSCGAFASRRLKPTEKITSILDNEVSGMSVNVVDVDGYLEEAVHYIVLFGVKMVVPSRAVRIISPPI